MSHRCASVSEPFANLPVLISAMRSLLAAVRFPHLSSIKLEPFLVHSISCQVATNVWYSVIFKELFWEKLVFAPKLQNTRTTNTNTSDSWSFATEFCDTSWLRWPRENRKKTEKKTKNNSKIEENSQGIQRSWKSKPKIVRYFVQKHLQSTKTFEISLASKYLRNK